MIKKRFFFATLGATLLEVPIIVVLHIYVS